MLNLFMRNGPKKSFFVEPKNYIVVILKSCVLTVRYFSRKRV